MRSGNAVCYVSPRGMNELALQLLLVLGVAFGTAWVGASINLRTRRRRRRSSKLRLLARRRRRGR